jgi:hypothetical protein
MSHLRSRWKGCAPTVKCQYQNGNVTDASGGWSLQQVAQTYSIGTSQTIVRKGRYSCRFEVRPGDSPVGSGERSEVVAPRAIGSTTQIGEDINSGTQFYGFSTYLDPSWTAPAVSGWGLVIQLHGPDSYGTSPAWGLNCEDRYWFQVLSGNLTGNSNTFFELNTGTNGLNRSSWTDWIIKAVYSTTTTGSLTLFRKDAGAANWVTAFSLPNHATLQYRTPDTATTVVAHYWKMGYYRPVQTTGTNILWNSGMVRAPCWSGVALAF